MIDPSKQLTPGHMPVIVSPSWLMEMLSPAMRKRVIERTKETLAKHDFDAIAWTGLSGALVAPIVAYEMDKTLLCVRIPGAQSHSARKVEGDLAARRYIIVDDFVSTGATVKRIYDAVKDATRGRAKCLGVVEAGLTIATWTPVTAWADQYWCAL